LKRLIDTVAQQAIKDLFVRNPLGRKVFIPYDKKRKSYKGYVGLNYMVGGTVGDMMKKKILDIEEKSATYDWPVRLLLTVHDELDFEIPESRVDEFAPMIAKEMCDVPEIKMPIRCDVEVGPNWGSLDKYNFKAS
jgi:DNA polymerase-1